MLMNNYFPTKRVFYCAKTTLQTHLLFVFPSRSRNSSWTDSGPDHQHPAHKQRRYSTHKIHQYIYTVSLTCNIATGESKNCHACISTDQSWKDNEGERKGIVYSVYTVHCTVYTTVYINQPPFLNKKNKGDTFYCIRYSHFMNRKSLRVTWYLGQNSHGTIPLNRLTCFFLAGCSKRRSAISFTVQNKR
jgi:hypothetical protein